jgi:hypothetical protein
VLRCELDLFLGEMYTQLVGLCFLWLVLIVSLPLELSGLYFNKNGGFLSTIYNMSGRVVSDIQTRAKDESLYIRYNTYANVVNGLKNDSSYEFIGEVILKINFV